MYSYYYSHTFRQVLPTTRYLLIMYIQVPASLLRFHSPFCFECQFFQVLSNTTSITMWSFDCRAVISVYGRKNHCVISLHFTFGLLLCCCVTMAYDMILETATKENVNNFLRDALYSSVHAYNKTYQASSKHLHLLLGTAPKTSLEQLSRLLLLVVHFLNIFKFMDMLSFLFSLIQVISRPFSKTRSIVSRDTKRIR